MILIVDDDRAIRVTLTLLLERNEYAVMSAEGPAAAMDVVRSHSDLELVLMDMNYTLATDGEEGLTLLKQVKVFRPDVPVILMTAWGTIDLAVQGMRNGAFDFITKPWSNAVLMDRIETAILLNKPIPTPQQSTAQSHHRITPQPQSHFEVVGQSPVLLSVLATAQRVAQTNAPVLITGESGTGKELIAQFVHEQSRRMGKPFVKVNLGGISTTLFESEMFGHKKGSFTDAKNDRTGRFELAEGGTIFLDEVGELPLSTQVRLLRVLQTGEYIRVGSARVSKTNVRVVAATNNDLQKAIAEGRFREDLYFRLNTVPIAVPPLRERKDDIPLLFRKFAADVAVQYSMPSVQLDDDAKQLLRNHYWRGNIRQLKNVAERISALETSRVVTADILATYLSPMETSAPTTMGGERKGDDFSTERELLYKILFDMRSDINDLKRMLNELMRGVGHNVPQPQMPQEVIGLLPSSVVSHGDATVSDYAESEEIVEVPQREMSKADMQREQILRALRNNNGRRRDAAKELFLSERTLYRRIKELGITDEEI